MIVAGLILMPVPILPGIPLVLAGLVVMLGKDHRAVQAVRHWFEKRTRKRTNAQPMASDDDRDERVA